MDGEADLKRLAKPTLTSLQPLTARIVELGCPLSARKKVFWRRTQERCDACKMKVFIILVWSIHRIEKEVDFKQITELV
jgi:hypothetical protein